MIKLEEFLPQLHRSENTKRAYRQTLRAFERFLAGREPTEELAREFLAELSKRGLKPSSIARHGNALRKYFKWLKKPIELELPSPKRKMPRWLDEEEVEKLINACETSLEKAIVYVLLDTGMRVGELLRLKVKDIDFEEGFLLITRKGGYQRWVPISEKALKVLKEYLDAEGIAKGRCFRISYSEVWRTLKELGERAGLEISLHPHLLRHTRASQLRLEGVALEDIKELLGHSNIQTTLIYTHIKPVDLKRKLKPILK